ncbi:MAG: hypothetical protein GTN80_06480 [Nitrososphaeria archaeon]|nr:hypothetical protein [Nitrososphaeria archaeon]
MKIMYWILLNIAWRLEHIPLEEWKSITSWPGLLIFLIVEIPMLFFILAALFGKPRKLKVTTVLILTLLSLLIGMIVITWIFAFITSMFIA